VKHWSRGRIEKCRMPDAEWTGERPVVTGTRGKGKGRSWKYGGQAVRQLTRGSSEMRWK
jgi:hypothetical protein